MKKKAVVELHNGLCFLHSNKESLVIPEITDEQIKLIRSENCIVIFAQHAVDGMTEITLEYNRNYSYSSDLKKIFCDQISFGKLIIISDPEINSILEMETEYLTEKVEIYVDDIEYPTTINIVVS